MIMARAQKSKTTAIAGTIAQIIGPLQKYSETEKVFSNDDTYSNERQCRWAGFADRAAYGAMKRDGYSAEAVAAMRAATGKLSDDRATGFSRAVVGAWDIPSVVSGLPLCATRNTRGGNKPLDVRVNFACNSRTRAEDIATQAAIFCKAIRDAILSGRVVRCSLVSHGVAADDRKKAPSEQRRYETTVYFNPSRDDELATALSMQFFRGFNMWTDPLPPHKVTAVTVDGAINFGDNLARMQRELAAVLSS